MKLILFRHGLTEANERHLYCGSSDLPLSERGRLGLRAIRASGALPALDGMRIFTSGARRCEETLFELYGDLPHGIDPSFREMDFGDFELRSYEEMNNESAYISWISGDNEANICPNGESGNQMKSRVLTALDTLIREAVPTALFTHGGPIASIMESLFPSEQKTRYQWQPDPGRGYVIETETGSYAEI